MSRATVELVDRACSQAYRNPGAMQMVADDELRPRLGSTPRSNAAAT